MTKLRLIGWFFLIATLWARPGLAVGLAQVETSHSSLGLHAESLTLAPGRAGWLAVRLEPRDGWHTYWKNPGDSGAAPILTWTLPAGLTAAGPLYGTPVPIPVGPLANYGYHGPSTLLVRLEAAADIPERLPIHLSAEWLVCDVECVPQFAEIDVTLKRGDGAADPADAALFAEARARLPEPSFWDAELSVGAGTSKLMVFMAPDEVPDLASAVFLPAEEGVLAYAASQTSELDENGLTVTAPRQTGAPTPKIGQGLLILTHTGGAVTAYELEPKLTVGTAPGAEAPIVAAGLPLWQAALFALLGGLVLNLMPCVFPVLSLKAFAFISANNRSLSARRAEGWAYTAGIWLSFMAIVAVLMILRAGGAAVGWGFQLQEPAFVALMTLLMVLVALMLGGLIHIRLGFEHAGSGLAAREGLQGAFFKGVLATLVATPCTAPLMAPAIGFALTQSVPVVFLVFSLLAFGLALPFLVLSYSATVARLMPRPGAWMEKLKRGLAFPMLMTAAWLVFIYSNQVGSAGTLRLLLAIILVAFAIWLWQQGSGLALRAFAAIFGLVGLVAVFITPPERASQTAADSADAWSEQRVAELVAANEPVFVYFTADWCITCKVNEVRVLDTAEIRSLFADKGVTVLKGDWTNRNSAIAQVLARYGRAGVPLYLYFAPGSKSARVLPEFLTMGAVRDALAAR